jgi:drug/metabolite transporter (DMT)-like permease
LRKVESSTLKECGEEKVRGTLHPKCRSERRKVSSLLSLHFFLLYDFFFLCVFLFFLLEKKKMPRRKRLKRKGRNKRAEIGTKSERAKRKLEGKLLSFLAFVFFFMVFFFVFFFLCLRKGRC